nr:TPA_exp: ABC transporter ATP-binding protein [Elizabethkingia anophelis]
MIASYYGKDVSLQFLRDICHLSKDGVSLLGISEAAKKIGFETYAGNLKISDFSQDLLPCVLHWNQNHFIVLYKIKKKFFTGETIYKIADPGYGFISLSEEKFRKSWESKDDSGFALFFQPTQNFYNFPDIKESKISLKYILKFIKPYKKEVIWVSLFMLLGSITMLFFPILTQRLIDDGVNGKNLSVIIYILLAQLALFIGNIIFNIFRNWITLVIGTKINILIISDFLKKLFKLPINFFETKLMGDFNQRILDHEKIESFLTSESLITIFSVVTFSVFFGVLWYYDYRILLFYMILTSISIAWSLFWLKKRRILDYFRFQQRSENQESIYEIINGVSEIKLNQFEDYKRNQWEIIQNKLFKINIRILRNDQIQTSGFEFINQLKNIIVTFLAAYFVIHGQMTLGALLSVSYIIGQMNSPINQLINFFRSLQDAKISLSRLNEVQNHEEEEKQDQIPLAKSNHDKKAIILNNVSFQYEGPKSPFVLENVNLSIFEGKTTAIVGASGSGKTTLMKLLLKFYAPTDGNILLNSHNILQISSRDLRKNSGVVMQDGFIFSDTIERNIATSEDDIDYLKLEKAIQIANIGEFINSLPLGLKTKIGSAGNGISGGQKQRILIARAVYKNPHYIFFDEATSALDAENERIIHDNLQEFFENKTVIVIAHRLSTVKNADHIIVLKNGKVIEQGNHQQLVNCKAEYYNLVKNQLELGD